MAIGKNYAFKGVPGKGLVIASADAIYLLGYATIDTSLPGGTGTTSNGVLDLIIGVFELAAVFEEKRTASNYASLPSEIREHPDWPVTKPSDYGMVVKVGRPAIDVIVHPRFSNLLWLRAGEVGINIEYKLFTGRKVREFLTQTGWNLQWPGPISG